ncbi:hypothetical protein C7974DRAFT_231132 [Boeremia exigua]|uniref:uncharacterized protein n=1 Tax=Boeremia exigua TaxID=749465 RepID=UPI001E8DD2CE|nr:uncharacterized protein C7974DRAFT_231132 [Boeremia exigua]KAH6620323.1 hypothetical protein C7974DRAFT_231132 [Boeremia exigua]
MCTPTPTPSPARQTANKLAAAYNTMDIPTIMSLRTPTCLRTILPASLNMPPQTPAAFAASLTALATVFTSFRLDVDDVVEGVGADGAVRIVMYVSAAGETRVGPYRNQYVWSMGFEEGGERVSEWSEFVDVGVARDFGPVLRGELERLAREGAKGKEEGV